MATEDEEDGTRECVSEDELPYASNIHCDAAEEVEGSGDSGEGAGAGATEFEETEHGCLEGDEETEQAEEGWVGWLSVCQRSTCRWWV